MFVIHNVNNHEPICLHLNADVDRCNVQNRQFTSNIAWHKAKQEHFIQSSHLREALNGIKPSVVALSRRSVHCKDDSLICTHDVSNACLYAAVFHLQYQGLFNNVIPAGHLTLDGMTLLNLLGKSHFLAQPLD